MAYPEWVEKQKRPGTNITCSKGKYYLYECKSVYDKEKKRSRKVTGKYLGRITEEGLIPPREKKDTSNNYSVKEYGASSVLMEMGGDLYARLKEAFPKEADELMTLAILRLIERCPFKRIGLLYEKSYLSELFPGLPLSSASLSGFLRSIGSQREKLVRFMNGMIDGSEHILFDGTNIITKSEEIYKLYKTRAEIEQTFDFLKNLLGADVVYLQDKYAVEGWAFINHLSLLLVYLIYARLRNADLLAKFSVEDFICHLKYIHRIKINSSWALSEISGKTQKLLDKLGLHIT